jgi:hypothetical protein
MARPNGLALSGYATANTAQQGLAYERWGRCNAPYVSLDRVDVDGRITFTFSNWSTRQEVAQCLAEAGRGRDAVARAGGGATSRRSLPGGPGVRGSVDQSSTR